MAKKLSDLHLKPSEITCSREDFLESEAIINDKNLSHKTVSKRVAEIVLWFSLLKEELGLIEEESNLNAILSRLEDSDDLAYIGLAKKIEEILWENVTLEYFHDLIQWNIDTIVHIWMESESVSEVFTKRELDSVYFETQIGRGVLIYFTKVLKDSELLGDCPIMRSAIRYFQENKICLDDIFFICNELKYAIKHFLYENTILSLRGYVAIEREIDMLLSKNLKNTLAYFSMEIASSRTEAMKELEQVTVSRNELKNIINALNNSSIVQVIGLDGVILDTNEKAAEIMGYSRSEMIGKNLNNFKSWRHSDKFWSNLWNKVTAGEIFRAVISNKASDGSIYWTDTTITPYRNPEGEIEKFIVIRNDITDLVDTRNKLQEKNDELRILKQNLTEDNEKLVALSNTDALTGLQNRRYFDYILEHEVRNSHITGNAISLVLLDIDDFKKINDIYGHDVGDMVLRKLGELVNRIKRQTDVSARYGGEEFVVVLSGTKLEWATLFADKLRNLIKSEVFTGDSYEFSVTVSMGVTQVSEKETPIKLFKRTDRLLYKAKHSGKDRSCS